MPALWEYCRAYRCGNGRKTEGKEEDEDVVVVELHNQEKTERNGGASSTLLSDSLLPETPGSGSDG